MPRLLQRLQQAPRQQCGRVFSQLQDGLMQLLRLREVVASVAHRDTLLQQKQQQQGGNGEGTKGWKNLAAIQQVRCLFCQSLHMVEEMYSRGLLTSM